MTSILSSHPYNWSSLQVHGSFFKKKINKVLLLGYTGLCLPSGGALFAQGESHFIAHGRVACSRLVLSKALMRDDLDPDNGEDGEQDGELPQSETGGINNDSFRKDLERIVGNDDATFTGVDLATLIRNKYGRSYDVLLIKKEFMGRNLLAMNVMWKYMEQDKRTNLEAKPGHLKKETNTITRKEKHHKCKRLKHRTTRHFVQRSFPLTEEEYLLRLDDIANTLKCWGAVSHIRNSLANLKERPRIGKAVSIFIDMDETGGRANEWIYK